MARVTIAELQTAVAEKERMIENLRTMLNEAREPITDYDDPRLKPLLIAAGEVAEDRDFCDEFEGVLEDLGVEIPEKVFEVNVKMRVAARSARRADSALDEALAELDDETVIWVQPISVDDFIEVDR